MSTMTKQMMDMQSLTQEYVGTTQVGTKIVDDISSRTSIVELDLPHGRMSQYSRNSSFVISAEHEQKGSVKMEEKKMQDMA